MEPPAPVAVVAPLPEPSPLELPPPPPLPPPAAFDTAFAPAVEATNPVDTREPPQARRLPMETAPSLVRLSEREEATRRRKVLVLGGVAALGGLILVLALVRWATRDQGLHAPRPAPTVAHVAPLVPAPVPRAPTVAPAIVAPPPAVVAPESAAASSPPPPPPSPTAAVVAAAPQAAAAARPKAPTAPRPAASPAPRPKKRKPAFDPNTL